MAHDDDDNNESNRSPEEEEPDKPDEHSGNIPPAEVSGVSDESGSSVDLSAVDGDPVTLLTPSVSVTLSTPSVEFEASSAEIITFIPETSASFGAVIPEDVREELEEKSRILLGTSQNMTHSDMDQREHDASEGSGGSSGESQEATAVTLSTDHNEGGADQDPSSELKITLIPHQTLTPNWEPEHSSSSPSSSYSSSSAPQESHPDQESGAEPPVTEESDSVSREKHAEITTRSIHSGEDICKVS